MQSLDRAKLIVRTHVGDLLAKVEDGQKTGRLMLGEMREDLREVRLLVAGTIADLKLIEHRVKENDAKAEQWEERAVFALNKAEEDLARRALARKHELAQRAERYREQLATQQETISTLKSSLKTLESKLDTMRYDSTRLEAHENLARRQTPGPTSTTTPVIDDGAFDAYDLMFERVRDLEAHAEAFAELMQGDNLEQEFHELESKNEVEKDLASLKAKVSVEE